MLRQSSSLFPNANWAICIRIDSWVKKKTAGYYFLKDIIFILKFELLLAPNKNCQQNFLSFVLFLRSLLLFTVVKTLYQIKARENKYPYYFANQNVINWKVTANIHCFRFTCSNLTWLEHLRSRFTQRKGFPICEKWSTTKQSVGVAYGRIPKAVAEKDKYLVTLPNMQSHGWVGHFITVLISSAYGPEGRFRDSNRDISVLLIDRSRYARTWQFTLTGPVSRD